MEKTVFEDHPQVDPGASFREQFGVDAGRPKLIHLIHLRPLDPLHREDFGSAIVRKGLGNLDVQFVFEERDELEQVAFFGSEVEFPTDQTCHFADGFDRTIRGEFGDLLRELRQADHDFEIFADDTIDPRSLNLDRHRLSRLQTRSVDLSDRGGCFGLEVERREELFDGLSKLALDRLADAIGWIGTDLVAQLLELFGELRTNEVGTGTEDLPDFDEGGPQIAQGQSDAGMRGLPGDGDSFAAVLELVLEELDVQPAQPVGQSILAEHREDLGAASQVPIQVGNGGDFHGTWMDSGAAFARLDMYAFRLLVYHSGSGAFDRDARRWEEEARSSCRGCAVAIGRRRHIGLIRRDRTYRTVYLSHLTPDTSRMSDDYASLARMIDHAVLRPTATWEELAEGCRLAVSYRVASICLLPYFVPRAAKILRDLEGGDHGVALSTVIGFPHGTTAIGAKVYEVQWAAGEGAVELDAVVNRSLIKSGAWDEVEREIDAVVDAVRKVGGLVKVIFESAELTKDEVARLCAICNRVRPDYVKTSTGFGGGGATAEAVTQMRQICDEAIGVKASGGIRDLETALTYRRLGATRLGTSSTAVILDAWRERLGT